MFEIEKLVTFQYTGCLYYILVYIGKCIYMYIEVSLYKYTLTHNNGKFLLNRTFLDWSVRYNSRWQMALAFNPGASRLHGLGAQGAEQWDHSKMHDHGIPRGVSLE